MSRPISLISLFLLAVVLAGASGFRREFNEDGTLPFGIRIEDSASFVGIARVKLSVSELNAQDGKLVGSYEIQIPLSKKNNDQGDIILSLPENFLDLDSEGGRLVGTATSSKEGEPPAKVVCDVFPGEDRKVQLAITTSERTIRFKSTYDVIVGDGVSSDAVNPQLADAR